jgi:hypothetical protein
VLVLTAGTPKVGERRSGEWSLVRLSTGRPEGGKRRIPPLEHVHHQSSPSRRRRAAVDAAPEVGIKRSRCVVEGEDGGVGSLVPYSRDGGPQRNLGPFRPFVQRYAAMCVKGSDSAETAATLFHFSRAHFLHEIP